MNPFAEATARAPRGLTPAERIRFEVGDAAAWKEAAEAVSRPRKQVTFQKDVAEAVRADASLSEDARSAALSISESLRDHAQALSRAAWRYSSRPGATPEQYERALRQ